MSQKKSPKVKRPKQSPKNPVFQKVKSLRKVPKSQIKVKKVKKSLGKVKKVPIKSIKMKK